MISKSLAARRRPQVYTALAASALVALGGCSSSGSGKTSGNQSGATGQASACKAATDRYFASHDTTPKTLPKTFTPLSRPPKAGGSIITVATPIPSTVQDSHEQGLAAKAIGWSQRLITYDGTVPDLNDKLNQAIAAKPTMITVAGYPAATMAGPIAAAKAAGITLVLSSVADTPVSQPGFAAVSSGPINETSVGELQAYLAMRDSQCSAHVLELSSTPPILKFATDKFEAVFKQNCPNCVAKYKQIQLADIGGPAGTSTVVSALQADPSIKYVFGTFANLVDGLPAVLEQSGITGVKIFGTTPDESSMVSLQTNNYAGWWVTLNAEFDGWAVVDAGLRAIDSGAPVSTGAWPTAVLTPANVPSGKTVPTFPEDFRAEFTKLWTAS